MAEAVRELGERAERLMWSPMSGAEAVIAVHWITLRMKQSAVAAGSALPDLAGGAFPTSDLLTWLANLGRTNYVQQPPPIPPN